MNEMRHSLPAYGNGISKEEWDEACKLVAELTREKETTKEKARKAEARADVLVLALIEQSISLDILKTKLREREINPGEEVTGMHTASLSTDSRYS